MRKQLPNYLLPSEAVDLFEDLVGKEILSIKTGSWHDSVEILQEKTGLSDPKKLWKLAHGGPLFISVDNERTFVFQSDDFTYSVAVRAVSMEISSGGFINKLYEGDGYFPSYLRVRTIVDLTSQCEQFTRNPILRIRIFKLRDGLAGHPVTPKANQVAVALSFRDSEDLIVSCGLNGSFGGGSHCLLTWDQLPLDFQTDSLECISQSPQAGPFV